MSGLGQAGSHGVRLRLLCGVLRRHLASLPGELLGLGDGPHLLLPADATTANLGGVRMLEGSADRTRGAGVQRRRQLRDHAVHPGLTEGDRAPARIHHAAIGDEQRRGQIRHGSSGSGQGGGIRDRGPQNVDMVLLLGESPFGPPGLPNCSQESGPVDGHGHQIVLAATFLLDQPGPVPRRLPRGGLLGVGRIPHLTQSVKSADAGAPVLQRPLELWLGRGRREIQHSQGGSGVLLGLAALLSVGVASVDLGQQGSHLGGPDGGGEVEAQHPDLRAHRGKGFLSAERRQPSTLTILERPGLRGGRLGLVESRQPADDVLGGRLVQCRGECQQSLRPGRIGLHGKRIVGAAHRRLVRSSVGLHTGRLSQPCGQHAKICPRAVDRRHGRATLLGQPGFGTAETIGAEQPLQHCPPLLGRGSKESREVVLRQQDHLKELLRGHAHELGDLPGTLIYSRAEGGPAAVASFFEHHPGRLSGGADPPALRSWLIGDPRDAQPTTDEGDLQPDDGPRVRRRVIRPEPRTGRPSLPGHPPVEREAEPVEQRGLAGTGVAVQEKEPAAGKSVQVEHDGPGKRTESGELQAVGTHQATCSVVARGGHSCSSRRPASSALYTSVRSPAVGGVPRTCSTNSAAMAASSSPRSRVR